MKSLVVGAGGIARQHIAALAQVPSVEAVYVCDLSPVTARAMADRFDLDGWFASFEEALAGTRPDVVHVTTPPLSHFQIAMDALGAGCHVIVEKPATTVLSEVGRLVQVADERGRHLIEDYNYLFNRRVLEARRGLTAGEYGDLVHVDVSMALDIFGAGSPYLDPATNRSFREMAGGPIADFLPHLASLAQAFVGDHRTVSTSWAKANPGHGFGADEFRALIEGERATASLSFSSRAQPDLFSLTVSGTTRRSHINIFEGRATHERQVDVARPLIPLINGLRESIDVGVGSVRGLSGKLSGGPGAYEGLWTLIELAYESFAAHTEPPVRSSQVLAVNSLVAALTEKAPA